jgi:hypothetical protein
VPDELQLLRELGREETEPEEASVERARAVLERRIDSRRTRSGRLWRRRLAKPAVALALAVGLGAGFGLAAWLSPSGSATSSFLGFGFVPSKGWTVVQSGTVGPTGTAHAIAANVPLAAGDGAQDLPYETLRRLPPHGAVIVARLFPRGNESRDRFFPLRPLPLRVAEAVQEELPFELSGTSLVSLRLRAGVAGYDVDGRVFLGGPASAATLAAVDEQLQRLIVAPGGITLVVLPTIIANSSQRLTIYGSVSSGKADQKVAIQFKACGLYPAQFRDAFETTTQQGGGYSLGQRFNLGVSGVFRAVSGDSVSADVRVQQRASVYLRPTRGGRYTVSVWGTLPFWRRYVLLQRFDRRRGVWITGRRLVLTDQGGGSGPAPPFQSVVMVGTSTEPFRPVVPKGTMIRAAFPLSQARPCYLAGYSEIRTT